MDMSPIEIIAIVFFCIKSSYILPNVQEVYDGVFVFVAVFAVMLQNEIQQGFLAVRILNDSMKMFKKRNLLIYNSV